MNLNELKPVAGARHAKNVLDVVLVVEWEKLLHVVIKDKMLVVVVV